MTLSERLRTVAGMVTRGNVVCDVGCDHGFTAIYLVQQGISPRALAMDLREGPLSAAGEHIAAYGLGERIETRLSDGLHKYIA
ncbi:MAG: class I SAM-dependent methyltransferase, partial [Lachnospiraceae bacterium]|nr:class I SAM-dependent methyltransferase [Lachnospiraceae bacterium]